MPVLQEKMRWLRLREREAFLGRMPILFLHEKEEH
jgi:hypothetical protein